MVVGVVIIETALALLAVIGAGKYWNLPPFRAADGSLDVATTETIILYLARHDLPVVAGCLLLGAGHGDHLLDREHVPDDPLDQPGARHLPALPEARRRARSRWCASSA